MGISEQAQEILDELYKVNPENLNEKARKLFDTVMFIADERDLYKYKCEKAIEFNKQIIEDTKEFYRSTTDTIYSGDCLIDIATHNINILQGNDNNE